MSYAGTKATVSVPPAPTRAGSDKTACACQDHARSAARIDRRVPVQRTLRKPAAGSNGFPTHSDGRPDFARMDVSERLAYHRQRLGLGR